MSSRFFIDFPDIETQTRKLESYLINHFNSDNELEMRYAPITTASLAKT